jgi:2-polyprenyl-6-methoxyphenol hydroxylase-like FAD-dependent oxidoreductase
MEGQMLDVVVVGARAAGAATAMMLARAGLSVAAVDRAHFPSDTLSTHQVQLPGIARLGRWGLLDEVAASAPAVRVVRVDSGRTVLTGRYPEHEGVDALYSPRRTVLDARLVAAARAAGGEVVEGFTVTSLTTDDGRVTGVRGRLRGRGKEVAFPARLVVGADGKRSFVAKEVAAKAYRVRPPRTFACYSYWSGLPMPAGELHLRTGLAVPAFPTNDGLTMVAAFGPIGGIDAFRRDVEGGFHALVDRCGDLGERLRAAERVERFRTVADAANGFRVPYGPGWALAGDAGLVQDPVGAQGISNAFRDADLLAAAVLNGLDEGGDLDTSLAGYHRARDVSATAMHDFVGDLARLRVGLRTQALFAALAGRPAAISRLLGALAGAVPLSEAVGPAALFRLAVTPRTRGAAYAPAR